ncbi:MAG: SDR family NAD(P)-dependent oxidoreductase [Planctomycetaceae bacterium]|nr:SDR family NAD(P)-dependent oxidoreductase [Planctomycetaceae bacterium]
MQISNHTFLVSGGSSGLGGACVQRLLNHGASVIVADLVPPPQHLADQYGARLFFQRTDVTSEADVRSVIATGEPQTGPLRGAVICAGVVHAERVLGRDGAASLDAFRRIIDINLNGTFNVVRLAADAIAQHEPLEDGERGVLVMTASVAAYDGQIGQAAYSASKGGIVAMVLPLARELARYGIRINAIAPGVFETPMVQSMPEKLRLSLIEQVPFPSRLGSPDEFAALTEQILTNRMLNGTVIRLDAAIRMS